MNLKIMEEMDGFEPPIFTALQAVPFELSGTSPQMLIMKISHLNHAQVLQRVP